MFPKSLLQSQRLKSLLVGLLIILLWQGTLAVVPKLTTSKMSLRASSGMPIEFTRFFYFYKYLDLFPMATEIGPEQLQDSKAAAEAVVVEHPETLVMDINHAIRAGDLGKIFLFLPSGWFGSVKNPTVHWLTAPLFMFSLMFLFYRFWADRKTKFGFFIVLALGSTTFMSYETYRNENIFSIPVSIALLLMGLHFNLLKLRKESLFKVTLLALFSGVLLGVLHHVRIENVLIALSLLVLYLFNKQQRWFVNLLVTLLFVFSFWEASQRVSHYISHKFTITEEFVKKSGGNVFAGPRHMTHNFWHAIYCGLGDFDWKFNYRWDDRAAAEYAAPILYEKYGIIVPKLINYGVSEEYYDQAHKYYKRPYERPEYGEVIKAKVIGDIEGHPFWYLSILILRGLRALVDSSGVSPFLGLLFGIPIPMLVALIYGIRLWRERNWFLLRFIAFPLPLLGVGLLVYSGGGTFYYCFSNILAFGMIFYSYYEKSLKYKFKKDPLKVFDDE